MNKSTERIISILLLEMGFQAHHNGFRYARTAVEMVLLEPSIITRRLVTKELYPGIATIHKTTPSRVDDAIRFAIETAFAARSHRWHQIIGHFYNGHRPPTNTMFFAQCAEAIKYDLAS